MKKKSQFKIWVSVVTIVLAGCTSGTKNENTSPVNSPVKVNIQKLETGSGRIVASYIGTIEESVSIPLSFLTTGTVDKVFVDEGQSVSKGQLLAVLNSADYKNVYQASRAKYEQAQDAYNRLESVYKSGSLPEIKFVEVKSNLEQARSMASISEKSLNDCKLYAPTSGVIGRRMIEPGVSAIPGNPVFELVKIEKVYVKIPVPEKEISAMQKGQDVKIRVAALGNIPFEGKITEIGVLSNPLSHTYMVKAEIKNQENLLKPGMVCETIVVNPELDNRMIIPLKAVQIESDGKKFVYVAIPGANKAAKKSVETGSLVSNGIVIKEGLSAGDLLIVDGYQKISNHSSIQY
jgi:RND family efflux transporter MFP subunit